jgi:hypothetical protein
MPKNLNIDLDLSTICKVCGHGYSRRLWRNQSQGYDVCAGCWTRGGKLTPYIKFVEVLSARPCENEYMGAVKRDPRTGAIIINEGEGIVCDVECKCVTCTARKVIRFHQQSA